MPELRKDPISQRWVIASGGAKIDLKEFEVEPQVKKGGKCPFCRGSEDQTPPTIWAITERSGNASAPDWLTRVIPNKFPALQIEGALGKRGDGLYDLMNGIGAHELVIESPDHQSDLSTYTRQGAVNVLRAFQARYLDLLNDPRFKYILIFKNFGRPAGASLEHCHCQLIATPAIPKTVMEEMENCLEYYNYRERCPFCDIIAEELASGERMVHENAKFVAIAPFAGRFAFETWILPKEHSSDFEYLPPEGIESLADMLQTVLRKQTKALKTPPYNFILHTAPCKVKGLPFYHWHIEIIPRLTRVSGVEWGTGFYINPVAPEASAALLRATEG